MARQQALPKPQPTPAPPTLDWRDVLLLNRLRGAEKCPQMSLISAVVADQEPATRAAGRALAREFIDRLKRLRELGLAFSFGKNWISDSPVLKPPSVRRRRSSVAKMPAKQAVSAVTASVAAVPVKPESFAQPIHFEAETKNSAPSTSAGVARKTESAPPPETVSAAARKLASQPRNQLSKITGVVHGRRRRRGQQLIFNDGIVGELCFAHRGRILVYCPTLWVKKFVVTDFMAAQRDFYNKLIHFAAREQDVRIYKQPEAVLLGAQKRGKKELKSEAKAAAARANGCRPPRPGSRPRGRPRRAGGAAGPTRVV